MVVLVLLIHKLTMQLKFETFTQMGIVKRHWRAREKSPAKPPEGAEAFLEKDVPSFEAPSLRWIHTSSDGPYYLAPDSAPPLPSGMWSELNPATVEKESKRIAALFGDQKGQAGFVDKDVREALAGDGDLGAQVVDLLEADVGGEDEPSD